MFTIRKDYISLPHFLYRGLLRPCLMQISNHFIKKSSYFFDTFTSLPLDVNFLVSFCETDFVSHPKLSFCRSELLVSHRIYPARASYFLSFSSVGVGFCVTADFCLSVCCMIRGVCSSLDHARFPRVSVSYSGLVLDLALVAVLFHGHNIASVCAISFSAHFVLC